MSLQEKELLASMVMLLTLLLLLEIAEQIVVLMVVVMNLCWWLSMELNDAEIGLFQSDQMALLWLQQLVYSKYLLLLHLMLLI